MQKKMLELMLRMFEKILKAYGGEEGFVKAMTKYAPQRDIDD